MILDGQRVPGQVVPEAPLPGQLGRGLSREEPPHLAQRGPRGPGRGVGGVGLFVQTGQS